MGTAAPGGGGGGGRERERETEMDKLNEKQKGSRRSSLAKRRLMTDENVGLGRSEHRLKYAGARSERDG